MIFHSTIRTRLRPLSSADAPVIARTKPSLRLDRFAPRARSSRANSTTHLLAMLRRALTGVRVRAEDAPLALTARSDDATHG